uniref:Leucine-rich repeat domain-containing protein n=1 Tax=Chaetoceros debilis TaxID=122233 RepID=A0A7S3QFS8_9STRA
MFLPSTVTSIGSSAFINCRSMRLLILPHDIDLSNVGRDIICATGSSRIAEDAGVAYEWNGNRITEESTSRRVNEWLFRHMDEAPFHKVCCNSSITTKQINDYLTQNGNDIALSIDPYHGMTPMHMLTTNPNAPAETIAALLDVNVEVAFCADNEGNISLDYARDYNIGGLVGIINGLCNHRHAA